MESGDILKLIMILLGIAFLCMTIISLAKRKMTEQFCLLWGFFSIVMILCGVFLQPSAWSSFVSFRGLILIIAGLFCVLEGAWFISIQVSVLIRKNQELAMQISLLNQENEKILRQIEQLTGKSKTEL